MPSRKEPPFMENLKTLNECNEGGPHWKFVRDTASFPVRFYTGMLNHIVPTESDIQAVVAKMDTLRKKIDDGEADASLKKLVEGVKESYYWDTLYNYAHTSEQIGRGSVYHSMMAQIEAARGNTLGRIGHRTKEACYKAMFFPEALGLVLPVMGYMAVAGLTAGMIEGGVWAIRKSGLPAAVNSYLDNRREKKELNISFDSIYNELNP